MKPKPKPPPSLPDRYPETKLSRAAVVGPLAALLALPVTTMPSSAMSMAVLFLACTCLLVLALLFASHVRIPFFSRAADLVVGRVVNARRNWETDTLRSFVEVGRNLERRPLLTLCSWVLGEGKFACVPPFKAAAPTSRAHTRSPRCPDL
jgi:hypothetical protein